MHTRVPERFCEIIRTLCSAHLRAAAGCVMFKTRRILFLPKLCCYNNDYGNQNNNNNKASFQSPLLASFLIHANKSVLTCFVSGRRNPSLNPEAPSRGPALGVQVLGCGLGATVLLQRLRPLAEAPGSRGRWGEGSACPRAAAWSPELSSSFLPPVHPPGRDASLLLVFLHPDCFCFSLTQSS